MTILIAWYRTSLISIPSDSANRRIFSTELLYTNIFKNELHYLDSLQLFPCTHAAKSDGIGIKNIWYHAAKTVNTCSHNIGYFWFQFHPAAWIGSYFWQILIVLVVWYQIFLMTILRLGDENGISQILKILECVRF